MGESSKFPKYWTFEIQILKLVLCLQNSNISSLNGFKFFYFVSIFQEAEYSKNTQNWVNIFTFIVNLNKGPQKISYSICPNFDSLWLG